MYRIADFNFDLKRRTNILDNLYEDYLINDDAIDFEVSCSREEIIKEANEGESIQNVYLEVTALHRKIAEWLPNRNAFVLHSACFDVDGVGVAFAAHSGTGKTTHMNRWMEYLGNKMTIVNGDKPIVRFFDDEPNTPYAYGTPWNGKEHLGCNMRTPLRNICFIERSDTNFVERLDCKAAISRIFNQVYMPKDRLAVVKTMELIDRLLNCCNLWIIHCNMDENAGELAYKAIFK